MVRIYPADLSRITRRHDSALDQSRDGQGPPVPYGSARGATSTFRRAGRPGGPIETSWPYPEFARISMGGGASDETLTQKLHNTRRPILGLNMDLGLLALEERPVSARRELRPDRYPSHPIHWGSQYSPRRKGRPLLGREFRDICDFSTS